MALRGRGSNDLRLKCRAAFGLQTHTGGLYVLSLRQEISAEHFPEMPIWSCQVVSKLSASGLFAWASYVSQLDSSAKYKA